MPLVKQSKVGQLKTITLPQSEYERLKALERRFKKMRELIFDDFFASPPVRNSKYICEELKKTGRYTPAFLKSIKRGLSESDFFTK